MCVYDITELNEDEAIMSVLNTESSVVSVTHNIRLVSRTTVL